MLLKRFVYQSRQSFARSWWRIRGRRSLKVFGLKIAVAPETVFPHYPKFSLPTGGCKSEIVRYGDYVQLHSLMMYLEQLPTPPTIVEVGAHHGAYAVLLGKKAQESGGKVVAVEPNPESFSLLKRNIALNGLDSTVICEEVAVMDRIGPYRLVMQLAESYIASGINTDGCSVECVTLRDLLSKYEIRHVDVLLIDVEGAELLVLRGFPWGMVEVGRIYCEIHPYAWERFGYSAADFEHFLITQGLRCFDMYLREYSEFDCRAYIGPTVLVEGLRQELSKESGRGFDGHQ